MILRDLFETALLERSHLPKPWNPNNIDPALLTYQEYYKIANEQGKWHDDDSYDFGLESYKSSIYDKQKFPKLINRKKINGLTFEFRLQERKINYAKRDPNGEYLRDENGQLIDYTPAEIEAGGLQPVDFMIAVYDDQGRCCGAVQDEWGCVLITVAREYRGFGLGPMLGQIGRSLEPEKTSGGFTNGGSRNFGKVHREFVRNALTSGFYRQQIAAGVVTPQRVKEIVASAKLENKPFKSTMDLGSNDPADWLLYADQSSFILYDKKLREVIERGGDDAWDWAERMIKGYILIRIPNENGLIVRFGADKPGLKKFMLTLGAGYCASENVPFAVDEDDLPFVDPRHLDAQPVDFHDGHRRSIVTLKAGTPDIRGLVLAERRFRKSFDRYDEFHNWLLDLADRKFRPEN